MGDPRKVRSKFSGPSHPWQKSRIDSERELKLEYGLKNKKEIWRASSLLKKFTNSAKYLIPKTDEQANKEKDQLLSRLARLGLMPAGAQIEEVLGLKLKDILERRFQSIVFKKGLARSMKQARQFITHEHVAVGDRKITSPSYLVSKKEEDLISFSHNSSFVDENHPERKLPEKTEVTTDMGEKQKKKTKKKEKSADDIEELEDIPEVDE